MTFTESIKTVYSKYADFNGRAVRSEFWWYQLFQTVVGIVLEFVPVVGTVWSLANILPSVSVAARRLHDTDRSGWWQILPLVSLPLLIPGIVYGGSALLVMGGAVAAGTFILLIVWFATAGTPGPNRFGDDETGMADAGVFD